MAGAYPAWRLPGMLCLSVHRVLQEGHMIEVILESVRQHARAHAGRERDFKFEG